ncbi:phage major capsid protein, HK97 family [Burkholderia sp. WP9]|uniref:phage major capsid protein n=1 Tax=Burkholderia sp. WP9 TaxID=1500263 RepID=UPI00089C21A6|nr:phage major capsid protein [Burkholderia sp. WP9]SEE00846.1 phage major capsid protein, HK97 family [Burkholderia sp. WP9]
MARNSIAASAVRNAAAAQAAFAKTGKIQRGMFAVRAEAGLGEIKSMIQGVNTSFTEFKAKNNERVDGIAADVEAIMAGMDKMAVQMAGGVGNTKAMGADTDEAQPVHASTGLRGSQIGAFYRQRAQASAGGAFGPRANFGIADFIRGAAGMSGVSEGVRAALSEGVGTDGGYAVPDAVMPTILDAMVSASAVLAAGASILPLGAAKSVTIPAVDQLPKPAWRNENDPLATGGPTFRPVTATPRSLAIVVPISRELLADAVDMDRAVRQALAQAFAKAFDRAALVGSGTAPEPLGLYGMTNVQKIKQTGSAFAYADMLAAYQAQLDADAPAPTSIIMAPRTLTGLAGLVDTLGQPLNAPALLDGVVRRPSTGVPTNLGDGANESLAFIGNFNTVQFVMRENFNVRLLPELPGSNGQLAFIAHARFDVVANYPQAITVIEGVTS